MFSAISAGPAIAAPPLAAPKPAVFRRGRAALLATGFVAVLLSARGNKTTKFLIGHQPHMLRTLRTPFILTVPLMLVGVAFAQKVQTNYDKSLDFSKFHTYAWREHPILRKNPHIGQVFSVALDLVRSEVNGDLTSKKYTRAESKPDFWVSKRGAMVRRSLGSKGRWQGWGHECDSRHDLLALKK